LYYIGIKASDVMKAIGLKECSVHICSKPWCLANFGVHFRQMG